MWPVVCNRGDTILRHGGQHTDLESVQWREKGQYMTCYKFNSSHWLKLHTSIECRSKHRRLCPQKIYKLRQTKFPQFVYFSLILREREETKTKYSTPLLQETSDKYYSEDQMFEFYSKANYICMCKIMSPNEFMDIKCKLSSLHNPGIGVMLSSSSE